MRTLGLPSRLYLDFSLFPHSVLGLFSDLPFFPFSLLSREFRSAAFKGNVRFNVLLGTFLGSSVTASVCSSGPKCGLRVFHVHFFLSLFFRGGNVVRASFFF